MDDQTMGVPELLAFVSAHPVEAMQVHVGSGPAASIDLICTDGARLIGVSVRYLDALLERHLLPAEIVSHLHALRMPNELRPIG